MIGWKEAIIRSVVGLVENNPLLLGALPAALAVLFSSRKQRFGDMIAGTVVIRKAAEQNPVDGSADRLDDNEPALRDARFGDIGA